MSVLLTSLIISVALKASRKRSLMNLKSKGARRYSSVKLLAVDSVKCYDEYANAVDKIGKITPDARRRAGLLDAKVDAAAAALTAFKTECAITTATGTDCADFLTDHATEPAYEDLADFKKDCKVSEPTANIEGCPAAYEALIKAIQDIEDNTKIKLHVDPTPDEALDAFVTKCAATAHAEQCFDVLEGIDTAVGPVEDDLADIQGKCNPTTSTQGGAGFLSFSLNTKLLMFICTAIQLYFFL
jgi:hypothetical protein